MKIALMSTCLADAMFPQVPQATTKLLRRLGHTVVYPNKQTCCGQMHVNTGYFKEALPVIEHHVRTFSAADVDAIVAPSGSCVGSVKHQHAMVAKRCGENGLAEEAAGLAAKTHELSELLVDVLGLSDVGAYFPHSVTYHPTCHSLRMLRVGEKPLQLLRAVDAIDLRELPEADQCCGFGGTFSIKNAAVSTEMLKDKVANVQQSGASLCSAGDSSCLMHIGGGLSKFETGLGTVHLAQILASTKEDPYDPRQGLQPGAHKLSAAQG